MVRTATVVGLLMPGACVGSHWPCRDEVGSLLYSTDGTQQGFNSGNSNKGKQGNLLPG